MKVLSLLRKIRGALPAIDTVYANQRLIDKEYHGIKMRMSQIDGEYQGIKTRMSQIETRLTGRFVVQRQGAEYEALLADVACLKNRLGREDLEAANNGE